MPLLSQTQLAVVAITLARMAHEEACSQGFARINMYNSYFILGGTVKESAHMAFD